MKIKVPLRILVCLSAICAMSLVLTSGTRCFGQKPDFDAMPLTMPGGWRELPDWAARDLPFETERYFGIADSQNRESLYLKAILNLDFHSGMPLIPDQHEFETEMREETERASARWKEFIETYEDFFDTPRVERTDEMIAKARRVLLPYRSGFGYLDLAQKREGCYFHSAIDTVSLEPGLTRSVVRKLCLRCNLDLSAPSSIEGLEIGLRYQRDLRKLGGMFAQLTGSAMEGICFDKIVSPILNNPEVTREQLLQLIRVLEKHDELAGDVDHVLEAAKYEHLMFKRLFHELSTETWLPRTHARELWGDDNLPRAVLVLRELSQLCFYDTRTEEVDNAIEAMAAGNKKIAEAAGKAKAAARSLPDPSALSTMILGPLLHGVINTMTPEDYDYEMQIMTTRYKQIEAAVGLPFPESTKALLLLREDWTTDGSWKTTKILKWFSPHKKLVSIRVRNRLRTRAMICLAAVRLWQLEHRGKNPADLQMAVAAASIDSVPIDVHSGQPLKMLVGDSVKIYSVGPDGKDDHAEREVEFWVVSPDKAGDIVFEGGF